MGKIIGIIVAVILLLGGAYFIFGRSSSPADESVSMEETASDLKTFSGTFKDLMNLGQDYKCTYNVSDDEGNETKGVVFIADGGEKMYGEFSLSLSEENSFDSYIIRDGKFNYIWSSMQPTGMKMVIEEGDDEIFSTDEDGETSFGMSNNEDYSFECNMWMVDNSKFTPPTDIEFVDYTQMVEEVTESFEESGVDCSMCDQMPDADTKSQCLSSLGC